MKKLNWDIILYDTYVDLYKNSTPSVDFNELIKNANLNDRGQRVIDFMAYEIEENKMKDIINSFVKKYKMNKINARRYSTTIYLGCSPKTKKV